MRLFRSSSLSAIRVVSPAYLRLLLFLQAILIAACVSSSPAFLMMYSAYIFSWAPYIYIFLGSRITADGDCSHEIKRHLLLGRKVMTNLNNILKSRDITLPTKICLVKAMVFPVVRYGCENWTIKKAEHRGIDAFEMWCWRVPWTARRSNQSILKEISPGCSLEGLMLRLKLQYFGTSCEELTHWKRPWCWGRLKVGGKGDDRRWDDWIVSLSQWTWVWVNSGSWW